MRGHGPLPDPATPLRRRARVLPAAETLRSMIEADMPERLADAASDSGVTAAVPEVTAAEVKAADGGGGGGGGGAASEQKPDLQQHKHALTKCAPGRCGTTAAARLAARYRRPCHACSCAALLRQHLGLSAACPAVPPPLAPPTTWLAQGACGQGGPGQHGGRHLGQLPLWVLGGVAGG